MNVIEDWLNTPEGPGHITDLPYEWEEELIFAPGGSDLTAGWLLIGHQGPVWPDRQASPSPVARS